MLEIIVQIIAEVALAKTFEWIGKNFGKDIVKASARQFKSSWKKFGFKGAAEKYAEDMKELHDIVHIWRMSKPVPLRNVFTQVNVLDKRSAFLSLPKDHLEKIYLAEATFGRVIEEGKNGLDAVRESERLFILGKPGAGKTTFLKYVTLQAIEGKLNYIPIFIPLGRFSETKLPLFEFITNQFKICDFPDAQTFIQITLKKGKAIVLCDGLDEVNKEDGLRNQVIEELNEFCKEYDESKFVITCRVAASEYLFQGFTYVEMADFSQKEIRAFVHHWFADNPRIENRFLDEFFDKKHKRLRELAKSPLLLTLLCVAFEEILSFPARRTEIYEEALDALLRKWDSSRKITRDEIYHTLSLGRKRQMFARIAAGTFEKGEYLFEQKALEKKIVSYLQNLPQSEVNKDIDGTSIVKAIEAQHGIFVERAKKVYSFSHLTFQEYYTAKYIVENSHKDTLKNLIKGHFNDTNWREVFLLTAELLDDADNFFEIFVSQLNEFIAHDYQLLKVLIKAENWANNLLKKNGPPHEVRSIIFQLLANTVLDIAINITSIKPGLEARTIDNILAILVGIVRTITECEKSKSFPKVKQQILSKLRSRALVLAGAVAGNRTICISSSKANFETKTNYNAAIELSKGNGLTDIHRELISLSFPSDDSDYREWRVFVNALLNIMHTYHFAEGYDFSTKSLQILYEYSKAIRFLLICLDIAYVSDRTAIEDRLLRPPGQTKNRK